jgi:hypothetical protein
MVESDKHLLNDEQMQRFLVDGYLLVKTEHPAGFHQALYEQAEQLIGAEYNPGNNLLPRLPALQSVWSDPNVAGALTSVLGPGYFLQPHRYCHLNRPGAAGQRLHRDGFFTRRHHTRWAVAFYYPHDVTEEMGPTAIVPGSQYSNTRPDEPEKLLCAEAGTVAIVEFNMWHRGTPNVSDRSRAMVKFLFARMEEPREPAWNSQSESWEPEQQSELRGLWSHLWSWHHGRRGRAPRSSGERSIPELLEALSADSEREGFEAAYELGAIGEPAVPGLMEVLVNAPDAERWHPIHETINDGSFPRFVTANVSHALAAAGASAVPALLEAAGHSAWAVRATAVETLGDLGLEAQAAVPALSRAAADENVYVRRHAAEALGTTSQGDARGVPALMQALRDEDIRVRRSATIALARIGPHAEAAVSLLTRALEDEDRYVRGNAVHALRRIGTFTAVERLLEQLSAARWCPITTRESPY